MGHALIVSKDETLNNIYEINLKAYVGVDVTFKKDLNEAKQFLELSVHLDAIYLFDKELSEEDGKEESVQNLEMFKSLLIERNLNSLPIIYIGNGINSEEFDLIISNRFDIRSVLKMMASILEVTAKDMAERPVPKYFPISINFLKSMNFISCDIYTRNLESSKNSLDYSYSKSILKSEVKNNEDIIDKVSGLSNETHVYIESSYRLKFINEATKNLVSFLDNKNMKKSEVLEIVSEVQGAIAEDIFEDEKISKELALISEKCIKATHDVAKKVSKLKNLISMLLANKSDYIFKHSILATYISYQIIDNISWGSKEQQEKIAFAFFFHDIALVPLFKKFPHVTNEEELLFEADLNDKEKELVLDHAKIAGDLIKGFPRCPIGSDMIITQHHGMKSGKGFAVNYKDDISPLSKIMIISEHISSYMLTVLNSDKKAQFNNKANIQKSLGEKFKTHTYKKIIDAFSKVEI